MPGCQVGISTIKECVWPTKEHSRHTSIWSHTPYLLYLVCLHLSLQDWFFANHCPVCNLRATVTTTCYMLECCTILLLFHSWKERIWHLSHCFGGPVVATRVTTEDSSVLLLWAVRVCYKKTLQNRHRPVLLTVFQREACTQHTVCLLAHKVLTQHTDVSVLNNY